MKLEELCPHTFKAIRSRINIDYRHQTDFALPSMPMVNACRANDLDLFQPLIESGDLTVDQMQHAAERYHLGKSKSGQTIYWMIDDMCQPLDGHMGHSWVSEFLKKREPILQYWQVTHCLFGLHLTSDISAQTSSVCIVESEPSAVILSELIPESIWMAYATIPHLTPHLLAPLQGRTVTIYPRTDPTMSTYFFFLDYADLVCRLYPSIILTVDDTLEHHATADQKARCIDLLDFILEQ